MVRVNFDDDVYKQLQGGLVKSGHVGPEGRPLRFPEWDILKELDRRAKRVSRDKTKQVREWMKNNPEKVRKVQEGRE